MNIKWIIENLAYYLIFLSKSLQVRFFFIRFATWNSLMRVNFIYERHKTLRVRQSDLNVTLLI